MNRYCFFTAQYLPTVGGVERYTYNLARELIKRDNEVIIITSLIPGTISEEITKEGIQIFRVPTIQLLKGRLPVTLNNKAVRVLMERLRLLHIDRVVVQTRLYTLSAIGVNFAEANGLPCIVIEHGTSYVKQQNVIVQLGEIVYEKILLHYIKRKCRNFCAVSNAGKEWIGTFGIDAKAVLYNSVKVKENSVIDEEMKKKLAIAGNSVLVTFVGRLIPEKGIVQLINAVKKLSTEMNIVLAVAGDGPLLKRLCKDKNDNIIFLGTLSHERVMGLLKKSDIYCLPSDSEGFPTGVLEAVVSFCYTIVAPYGGAKELIEGDDYGLLLDDNTEEKIADGLKKAILLGEGGRKKVTENAYRRFEEGFTWEKTCDTLENLDWRNMI